MKSWRTLGQSAGIASRVLVWTNHQRCGERCRGSILWRRAKLIRLAVTLAGLSMFFSCVLVLAIFVDAMMGRAFGLELVIIFIASVLSLISSVVAFLRDIFVSLHALALEVAKACE